MTLDTKRLRELADRLVASGPKAAHVSASECHEIADGVHELLDQKHGAEAEELRRGIEHLLVQVARADGHDARLLLIDLKKGLRRLLDRIDARDSLAYLEARDEKLAAVTKERDAAIAERDEARKHLDGRIEWQVRAVAHMQTWSTLFLAAVAMREYHEGCVADPKCGGCIRCRFDTAVDEAMKATSANSQGFIEDSTLKRELAVVTKARDEAIKIARRFTQPAQITESGSREINAKLDALQAVGVDPEPSCASCGFTREGCVQAVGCDFGEVPR